MSEFRPTIGLEIHAELNTRTKIFCGCRNDPDESRPNINICPVCMAHPGSLPVINREAVRSVLLVGTAVGGTLADRTLFDRKNYFYPDIPKGYQISQYEFPLVKGGQLAGVALTRVHLEEDTARSQHTSTALSASEEGVSLVDFNRAGVPLMELVTEPVIHSAAQAGAFARELQLLLRYLRAGEANMEKGEMRVEANISISDTDTFGTKVEIKNLNSFRSVERAIAFELERQEALLRAGEKVEQETRGWDEAKQETFSQRKKESSHDYRYFPEPDLPELRLSEIPELTQSTIERALPELPWQRRERYLGMGLKSEDAEMYARDRRFADFFDLVSAGSSQKVMLLAANYLSSDIAGKLQRGEMQPSWLTSENARRFAKLMSLADEGTLSSRGAKETLGLMIASAGEPEELARSNGLMQESDEGKLRELAERIVSDNQSVAADFKAGKEASLQFLIGQGMKATKGSANPQKLKEVFEQVLSASS